MYKEKFQKLLESEWKISYFKSGYIDLDGKVLWGNHNELAKRLGFKNRKEPVKSGYVRFYIENDSQRTTFFETKDKFSFIHINKFLKNFADTYQIKKIVVSGNSTFHEDRLTKWFNSKYGGETSKEF